jgi:prophage regulatory protein
MEKLLLKISDVAKVLNIGRSLSYELITQGQIPSIRVGRCLRVSSEALEKWIKDNQHSNPVETQP